MLYPYFRTLPPRGACAMDRWLGDGWIALERHEIHVRAAPPAALATLAELRIRDLPWTRVLLALRRIPFEPDMTLRAFFSTSPFVRLDEEPGREIVSGILLPAREPPGRGGERRVPRTLADFRNALPRAPVAAVATFRAEPEDRGARLWTETWIRTRGATATALFAAYWLAIGPWSAWIRRMFLREARSRAEAGAATTGPPVLSPTSRAAGRARGEGAGQTR
jgi:hypothetical protein